MKTHTIKNGWYCDALPNGDFCALLRDDSLDTHGGRVPLCPEGNVLFVRIAAGDKIAGQGHADHGHNWLWDGEKWNKRSLSYGVSPVIFDKNGTLDENDGWAGSQGFRFVSDRIYTGDETYFDPSLRLNEWTRLGNLTIGIDNATDNAVLHGAGPKRLVSKGICRFIRLEKWGSDYSIAMWRQVSPTNPAGDSHFIWFNESEVANFPIFTETPPVESPLNALKALRSSFPTPLGARHAEFLLRACQVVGNGAGLHKKDAGTFIVLLDGRRVAQDWIVFPDETGIDFLTDAETTAEVVWGPLVKTSPGSYVNVSGVIHEPPSDPPPDPPYEPPPPSPDALEMLEALTRLSYHLGVR